MKLSPPFFSLLLIFVLPVVVSAQAPSSELNRETTIEQIISQSGLAEGIKSSPREISAQFASNPFGLEASKNNRMIELFRKAYGDGLREPLKQTFEEQYQPRLADEVISWLNEEPAQRIFKAEKDFHSLQGSRKQIVRRYELEQDPPSNERRQVIRSVIEATSAVEAAIESQLILFRSIISAFSILSDQQTFSEEQIDGIVSNYRMQLEPQMQQEMARQLLITYFEIDSELLKQYASFYQTDAGRWLNSTSREAVQDAYRAAGTDFIESVKGAADEQP